MEKKILISVIIIAIIVLGFVVAIFLPELTMCTQMACPCEEGVSERPCNSCTIPDPIFTIGIFHISKICSGQEVILCENNIDVGKRIDIDHSSCNYKLSFLIY